jgi:hypothetical protein
VYHRADGTPGIIIQQSNDPATRSEFVAGLPGTACKIAEALDPGRRVIAEDIVDRAALVALHGELKDPDAIDSHLQEHDGEGTLLDIRRRLAAALGLEVDDESGLAGLPDGQRQGA